MAVGTPADCLSSRKRFEVFRRPDGFFDPSKIGWRHFRNGGNCVRWQPRAIGIDHQRYVRARRSAGRSDSVRRALVQFDLAKAFAKRTIHDAADLFGIAVVLKQGCVDLDAVATAASQQGRNRQSREFAPDVPQRNVQAANRVDRGASTTEIVQGPFNPRRQFDVIDFLPNRQRGNPLLDRRNDRGPKAAIGFTPAHRALIGRYPHQNSIEGRAWPACEHRRGGPVVERNREWKRRDRRNPG